MGNVTAVINDIKRTITTRNTFEPIQIRLSHRYTIITHWLKETKTNGFVEELMDLIISYSHYILKFIPENLYYKVLNSALCACKVEASTHPMTHEHDAYPECAGILFGGIFEKDMRYYCTFHWKPIDNNSTRYWSLDANDQYFESTSNHFSWWEVALVTVNHIVGVRFPNMCRLPPVCTLAPPSRDIHQCNILHVMKITVDMKAKLFILHNQTTNKELGRESITKDECRICFRARVRHATFTIEDQKWFC